MDNYGELVTPNKSSHKKNYFYYFSTFKIKISQKENNYFYFSSIELKLGIVVPLIR